jgi:hypothetical protein
MSRPIRSSILDGDSICIRRQESCKDPGPQANPASSHLSISLYVVMSINHRHRLLASFALLVLFSTDCIMSTKIHHSRKPCLEESASSGGYRTFITYLSPQVSRWMLLATSCGMSSSCRPRWRSSASHDCSGHIASPCAYPTVHAHGGICP